MISQLKKKNKIYLLTKNLWVKKLRIKKLNHIQVRSFLVDKIKRFNNYQLQLSADIKIHLIFHISLLKSADLLTLLQITFHYQIKKDDIYETEKILKFDNQNYLIKWKRYSDYESIWKLSENLINC